MLSIKDYADYNLWCNTSFAEVLKAQLDETLDREIISSFPSLRLTVNHIYDAETVWLMRLQGASPNYWPSKELPEDTPIDFFVANSKEFRDFVHSIDEAAVHQPCPYLTTTGETYDHTPWQMVMHCMNHSTFHRGQLVTMFRQIGGIDIPRSDLIWYWRKGIPEPSK